jgi:hypothetical protein
LKGIIMFNRNFVVGLAIASCATIVIPSVASAAVVVNDKLRFTDGPGASPGGAFIISDWNSTQTTLKGSFQSFCLEYNESINVGDPAATFLVNSITTEARRGGVGGVVNTPVAHDPLDSKTAWLYTQYIANPGVLNSVTGWSALSAVDKGTNMQNAIWYIEEEINSVSGVANELVNAAIAANWTDTGNVKVLNLTWWSGGGALHPQGSLAQDQLYLQPIPEPETYAMLLAGLGLMGFVARRRRQSGAV